LPIFEAAFEPLHCIPEINHRGPDPVCALRLSSHSRPQSSSRRSIHAPPALEESADPGRCTDGSAPVWSPRMVNGQLTKPRPTELRAGFCVRGLLRYATCQLFTRAELSDSVCSIIALLGNSPQVPRYIRIIRAEIATAMAELIAPPPSLVSSTQELSQRLRT
jgi:hypothetical protein